MEVLKEIRRQRGLSQLELSRATGVAQNTISEIESGHREARPSTLRKLADALDAEVADFFPKAADEALDRLRNLTTLGDRLLTDLKTRPDHLSMWEAGEYAGRYGELTSRLVELERAGGVTQPVRDAWRRLEATHDSLRPHLDNWKGRGLPSVHAGTEATA